MIQTDLDAASDLVPGDQYRFHLAGGGVAQYEQRLLRELGSRIPSWCHYRCADTSVTAMVTRIPRQQWIPVNDDLELDMDSNSPAATRVHRGAADLRAHYATAQRIQRSVTV